MTTPIVIEIRRNGNPVGERVELARYTIPAGERVLYGQRILGVVRISDVPASGCGRSYLVERGLEQEGAGASAALRALIDDYLGQARGSRRCRWRPRSSEQHRLSPGRRGAAIP